MAASKFGSILNNIANVAKNIATNFANDFGSAYIPNYTPITNNNWGNTAAKKEEPKYYQPSIQDLVSQTANSAFNNIDFTPKTPNIQELTKNFKDGLNNISDVFDEDSLFSNISKAVKSDKKEDKNRLSNAWGDYVADPWALPAQAYAEDYANADIDRRRELNPIAQTMWEWSPTDGGLSSIQNSLDNTQLAPEAIGYQNLQDFRNQANKKERAKTDAAYNDMVWETIGALAAPIGITTSPGKAAAGALGKAVNAVDKGLSTAGKTAAKEIKNTVKGVPSDIASRYITEESAKKTPLIFGETPYNATGALGQMLRTSYRPSRDAADIASELLARRSMDTARKASPDIYETLPGIASLAGLFGAEAAGLAASSGTEYNNPNIGFTRKFSSPVDAINKGVGAEQNLLIDQIYNNDFYDAYDSAHGLAPGKRYTSFNDIPIESLQEENRRNNIARELAKWQKDNPNNGLMWKLDDLNKASQLHLDAINTDPDYAQRDNEDWVNTANEGAKLFSNDYQWTDMPLFSHRYVQDKEGAARRNAIPETWMPLINTEGAPKEYDQQDRFLYNIIKTPEGRRWAEEAVPDIFDGLSEEELNGGGNLDNAFTKWRLVTLNNTEDNLAGSMSDSVDRLWADIFTDATGIPLERGEDGRLTEESKNLVDNWALTPENIFYLDQYINNPDYINDPTFLNYGFDANAISDLTQFLANREVIPLDIQDQYGADAANMFDADDLAQYMTMALLQRQNKKGQGVVGGIDDSQMITDKTLNQIFPLAGDVSFTRSANYGNRPEDQNLHAMRTLNPGNENDWYTPVLVDKEGNAIENPVLSDRFASTVLAMNPDMYIYDPKKYKTANEKNPEQATNGKGFVVSPYDEDVPLMNPMWW